MVDEQVPRWLKYATALVLAVVLGVISALPDLKFPSPQEPGWAPRIGLFHSLIVGASFSLIILATTALFTRAKQELWARSLRRGVLAFLLFATGDFALQISERPVLSEISRHPETQGIVVRAVQAGRGFLLPFLLLGGFLVAVYFRFYRRN